MSRKIKFCLFTTLYHCFAFLADKSGGWQMFVKPKILFGSLILGLGSTSLIFAQEPIEKQKNNTQTQTTNDTISQEIAVETLCFVMVINYPEFPGGYSQLMKFINNAIVYPKEAMDKGIEGVVFCTFVVDRDGSTTDVEVIRGVHPLLDKEAIRVINSMPKWYPGKQLGKSVKVRFTLPIHFKIEEKKNTIKIVIRKEK